MDEAGLLARMNGQIPPFPKCLGMRFVAVKRDHVVAKMTVREDFSNGAGVMHGDALMAFADTVGAVATFANLAPGLRTTTLESKTNFISSAPIGDHLRAEATPIHKGKTTQVWTTRMLRQDGRLVAIVTQKQSILQINS